MTSVALSQAVRSNLLSLQNTASLLDATQTALATGNKVNSALDNPTSYFTASSLNSRAADLGNLLDSVSNAVQTIQAANDGITSIAKLVDSAKATANQAQQLSEGLSTATISGTSFSTLDVSTPATTAKIDLANYSNVDLSSGSISFDLTIDGFTQVVPVTLDSTSIDNYNLSAVGPAISNKANLSIDDFTNLLNAVIAADYGPTNIASNDGTKVTLTSPTSGAGSNLQIANLTETGITGTTGLSNQALVSGADGAAVAFTLGVNGANHAVSLSAASVATYNTAHGTSLNSASLSAQEVASLINGQVGSSVATVSGSDLLLSSSGASPSLTISGYASTAASGSIGLGNGSGTTTGTANPARAALVSQYNGLLDQIDQLAADSGYNGNNLLGGASTQLKVLFNETGTSSLTITGKDVSASGLGLAQLASTSFDTNTSITAILANLKSASDTLRADASSFGSNLSIVQTRQDFTKALINTLQTGAANLTLADSNEEAANLLALQTRQSLSTKALSLASQSDQNVLRLLQ